MVSSSRTPTSEWEQIPGELPIPSTTEQLQEEYHPDLVADPDFLRDFIASQTWTFAKTMPQCPHWYIVRGKGPKEEDFARFVRHIRSFGYDEQWHRLSHRYLDFEGSKYWTMGYVYSVTIIINRCDLSGAPHPFRVSPQAFFAKPPTKGIHPGNNHGHEAVSLNERLTGRTELI